MHKVKRWRYYCDYCKKAGGSAYHIKKHEKGCTANPNRTCGLCLTVGAFQQDLIPLIHILRNHVDNHERQERLGLGVSPPLDWKPAIETLRELTEDCPACILAAIRQSGLFEPGSSDPEDLGHPWPEFKVKDEFARFWADANEQRLKDEEIDYF